MRKTTGYEGSMLIGHSSGKENTQTVPHNYNASPCFAHVRSRFQVSIGGSNIILLIVDRIIVIQSRAVYDIFYSSCYNTTRCISGSFLQRMKKYVHFGK